MDNVYETVHSLNKLLSSEGETCRKQYLLFHPGTTSELECTQIKVLFKTPKVVWRNVTCPNRVADQEGVSELEFPHCVIYKSRQCWICLPSFMLRQVFGQLMAIDVKNNCYNGTKTTDSLFPKRC